MKIKPTISVTKILDYLNCPFSYSLKYIEESAVIYHKSDNDSGKIIACLRAATKEENKILDDLTKLIPSYMLPNEFRFYDHLPKNQNGKIDRLKLKEEYLR